jgi:hypothetical protein
MTSKTNFLQLFLFFALLRSIEWHWDQMNETLPPVILSRGFSLGGGTCTAIIEPCGVISGCDDTQERRYRVDHSPTNVR